MSRHLIILFLLYYLTIGQLREVKTEENSKPFVLKVVTVAYEGWRLQMIL